MTPSGSLLLWVSIQSGEARSITDTCWTRDWLGIYFGHTGPPSRSFSVKGETSHFSLGMSRKFARYKTPEIKKKSLAASPLTPQAWLVLVQATWFTLERLRRSQAFGPIAPYFVGHGQHGMIFAYSRLARKKGWSVLSRDRLKGQWQGASSFSIPWNWSHTLVGKGNHGANLWCILGSTAATWLRCFKSRLSGQG